PGARVLGRLQTERIVARGVARNASRVARSLLGKDRLNRLLVAFVVERLPDSQRSYRSHRCQKCQPRESHRSRFLSVISRPYYQTADMLAPRTRWLTSSPFPGR